MPVRHSSMRMRVPASPKHRPFIIESIAVFASAESCAMITPLPSASPSALTTRGNRASSTKANAASHLENAAPRAVGILLFRINSFAKILEDSSRAADCEGPKTHRPSRSKRSTMPAASGSSGPTIVNSIRFSRAKRANTGRSFAAIGTFSPSSSVPAFPGAQKIRETPRDCPSFHTSACSRPPPPITRIFTAVERFPGA